MGLETLTRRRSPVPVPAEGFHIVEDASALLEEMEACWQACNRHNAAPSFIIVSQLRVRCKRRGRTFSYLTNLGSALKSMRSKR